MLSISDLILDLLKRLTPSLEIILSLFCASGVIISASDRALAIPPTPPNSDL